MALITINELCQIMDDHKINVMLQKVVSSVGFYQHYHNYEHKNDQIKNRSYIVYDMTNYEFTTFTKLFNDFHIFTAIEDCKENSFTIFMKIKTADTKYNFSKTIDNNEEFVSVFNDAESAVGKILKIKKLILFQGGELEW